MTYNLINVESHQGTMVCKLMAIAPHFSRQLIVSTKHVDYQRQLLYISNHLWVRDKQR
jgi:hypothetical protein